jgi:hypothetical protein
MFKSHLIASLTAIFSAYGPWFFFYGLYVEGYVHNYILLFLFPFAFIPGVLHCLVYETRSRRGIPLFCVVALVLWSLELILILLPNHRGACTLLALGGMALSGKTRRN